MNKLKILALTCYALVAFVYYLGALSNSLEKQTSKMQAAHPVTTPTKPASQISAQPSVPHVTPKPTTASQPAIASNTPQQPSAPLREAPPRRSSSENLQKVNTSEVLSFEQALQLADDGDARAQAIVSIYYGVGYKTQKDTAKAADYAMRSAKQRNGLGVYRVAAMMENGDGFQKDVDQAKKLKEMAFDGLNSMQGDPYALTALGIMLFRGEGGLQQNKDKAVQLYQIAARTGYAPAQYNYSAALALGQGVIKNQEESMKWWRMAYDQDYPPAMSGPVGQASSNANPVQNQTATQTAPSKPRANQKLPHGIPVAGRPGFVSSPYAPGAGIVDARGAASGDTVICPFTKQPFLLP
jgi:hypothetical protein